MITTKISKINPNGWVHLVCDAYPGKTISIRSDRIHSNPKVGDEVIVEKIQENDRGFWVAFMPQTPSHRPTFSNYTPHKDKRLSVSFPSHVLEVDNVRNFALFVNKPTGFLFKTDIVFKKYSILDKKKQEDAALSRNADQAINNFRFDLQQLRQLAIRQDSYIKTISQSFDTISTELHPNSRLAIGLGTASVYETGMLLHHVYGFPYIPASSVKGVLRSHIIAELFGNDEAKALKNKTFCDIFGCSGEGKIEIADSQKVDFKSHYKIDAEKKQLKDNGDRQGKVIFLDALPSDDLSIKIDVMTPHYGDYYNEKKDEKTQKPIPPSDYLSPTPITFLTVANTTFTFRFGLQLGEENASVAFRHTDEQQPILSLVKHHLTQALTQHGIGAKTAVGYGYMKE